MKITTAVFATLLGVTVFSGSGALAACPPRPPDVALDSKEGYSQSYGVHRCYVDRNGANARGLERQLHIERLRDEERRRADRDDYLRRLEREEYRRQRDRDDYRRRADRDDYRRRADPDDYRRRRDRDSVWRRLGRDDYARRDYRRDDYYERRLRRDDPTVGIATEILRRALSN